ncbi:uncharacterized protein LOC142768763 [Rhipicephalus microplus]|uniref:uncharacterized protein LOC142768763 n=1 Tax=Rhipicephalus microplus TaxID=6941 RepID=UPI003F6B6A0E
MGMPVDKDASVQDVSVIGNLREATPQRAKTRHSGKMSFHAPHHDIRLSTSDEALSSEQLLGLRGTTLADTSSEGTTRTRRLPNRSRLGRLARRTRRRRGNAHPLLSSRVVAHLILLRARLQADLHENQAMQAANSERRIPQNDTPIGSMDIMMGRAP